MDKSLQKYICFDEADEVKTEMDETSGLFAHRTDRSSNIGKQKALTV